MFELIGVLLPRPAVANIDRLDQSSDKACRLVVSLPDLLFISARLDLLYPKHLTFALSNSLPFLSQVADLGAWYIVIPFFIFLYPMHLTFVLVNSLLYPKHLTFLPATSVVLFLSELFWSKLITQSTLTWSTWLEDIVFFSRCVAQFKTNLLLPFLSKIWQILTVINEVCEKHIRFVLSSSFSFFSYKLVSIYQIPLWRCRSPLLQFLP